MKRHNIRSMLRNGQLLFYLLSIAIFITLGQSCDSSRNQPKYGSFEEATKWYLSSSELQWMYPKSTLIHKAAYHQQDHVMIIFFKPNVSKGYIYGGVPPIIWEEFNNAPSKGKYYLAKIKRRYYYKLRIE